MTKSIKKLFWASMASAVMMTAASCEKTDPQPEKKPEPPTSVTKRTVKYSHITLNPFIPGSDEVNDVAYSDENGNRGEFFIRNNNGKYRVEYLGKGNLFPEGENPQLVQLGANLSQFKANKREFMIHAPGDTIILVPANAESIVYIAYHTNINIDNPSQESIDKSVSWIVGQGNSMAKKMKNFTYRKN